MTIKTQLIPMCLVQFYIHSRSRNQSIRPVCVYVNEVFILRFESVLVLIGMRDVNLLSGEQND